jgi:3-hydroxyacyl-CoA dehydrogenase
MAKGAPVFETAASVMSDIGDGVAALELRTKMNVWTPQAFEDLERAIDALPGRFKAMVLIGGGVRAFSAGADLSNILALAQAGNFEEVDRFVAQGQHAFTALRQSKTPVVAAGFGLALGGGCEALLHAQAVVAHAELNAGLVETKVGLVPGWGGCTRLYARALEAGLTPAQAADEVFDAVFAGRTSASALDAAGFRVLRAGDVIVMNRDNLLVEAKAKALSLAGTHRPVTGGVLKVEGEAGRARLLQRLAERPQVTAYDQVIGEVLAELLSCGGPAGEIPESAMMQLERDGLVNLSRRPETQARISHMLATGKPLRN